MKNGKPGFKFAGHAIGVTAQFHRLDETEGLNHQAPALGKNVLKETGERSHVREIPYKWEVDVPRKRRLLVVDRVETVAEGRELDDSFETEVSIEIGGLEVVEMLTIDLIKLHMQSSQTAKTEPMVSTKGNSIEGMRLGNVEAVVTIDPEPLLSAGTEQQLVKYHGRQSRELPKYGERYRSSIIRNIELVGSEKDKHGMCVLENVIVWKGFGRIILGEINVRGHERQLTMVRLAMGSSAGGSAAAADGQSNGQPIVTGA